MSLRVRWLLALLATIVTALWLLVHNFNQEPSSHALFNDVVSRQPPSVNGSSDVQTDIGAYVNSSDPKLVALTFGRHDLFRFSPVHTRPLSKRALDPKYDCLVEKGRKYYESGILPAFDGHSSYPTPPFDDKSFKDNGWSRKDDDDSFVPHAWEPAFAMVPEGRPSSGDESDRDVEATFVFMSQDEPFTNDQGQQKATGAYYNVFYLPETMAIIASTTYSPIYQLQEAGVPADQINNLIPPLHRLSDVIWANIAKPLMDDIFNERRGTEIVPWENRLTFGLDSKEGLALLGSPNGLAVAWILIHRAQALGRREPRVTIFNPDGTNRCMIWDLVPQGGEGMFGDPLPSDSSLTSTTSAPTSSARRG
ncbi:hypothetical protein Q9189_001819 [Teloschistes chrysophthalmus]